MVQAIGISFVSWIISTAGYRSLSCRLARLDRLPFGTNLPTTTAISQAKAVVADPEAALAPTTSLPTSLPSPVRHASITDRTLGTPQPIVRIRKQAAEVHPTPSKPAASCSSTEQQPSHTPAHEHT